MFDHKFDSVDDGHQVQELMNKRSGEGYELVSTKLGQWNNGGFIMFRYFLFWKKPTEEYKECSFEEHQEALNNY